MSKGRIVLGVVTVVVGLAALGIVAANPVAHSEVHTQNWSFNGFFGSFEQPQVKRGFQIYKDVCSGCHSMHLLAYRDLRDIGFTEDEVKAIAEEVQVQDGPNDAGDMSWKSKTCAIQRIVGPSCILRWEPSTSPSSPRPATWSTAT